MVSIMDVAPLAEQYAVMRNGETHKFSVRGISIQDLVPIVAGSPEVRKLMADRADRDAVTKLIQQVPHIVARVISLGIGGTATDDELEAVDKNLAVGEKYDLLRIILRLTFPQGVGPFVADLLSFAQEINRAVPDEPSAATLARTTSAPSKG